MEIAYKFLRTGLKSNKDGSKWTLNKWRCESKPIRECEGLNASKYIQDALYYVQGEILAIVEYDGKVIEGNDKITCEKMRIIKRYKWTKQDSIELAIYCAELSLPIFEKEYPEDKRPREAIEAAKACIKNPSKKNKDASYAAYAAASYAAAASASYAAASVSASYAAAAASAAAAYAAAAASVSASYASVSASYAAAAASAAAATKEETRKKIHKFILKMKRIKE
jgi:hypothetical protein